MNNDSKIPLPRNLNGHNPVSPGILPTGVVCINVHNARAGAEFKSWRWWETTRVCAGGDDAAVRVSRGEGIGDDEEG